MRSIAALACLVLFAAGCGKKEENPRPALERAQEKLESSIEAAEAKLAQGTEKAREMLVAARERWEELRPEAEKAIRSLEERIETLARDSEALKRLPPDVIEKVRARLDAMRDKLAEAEAAHDQGNTDLAVEKADDVQKEREAVEEMLVERPDPPGN